MSELTPNPKALVRPLPEGFTLSTSGHVSFERGACIMEAVAYVAGEKHSDHPQCACPVLTSFCIRLNDGLFAKHLDELRPYVEHLVGTRGSKDLNRRRAFACADWGVREMAPIALEHAKRKDLADELRALKPIVDWDSAIVARDAARAVREKARTDAAYAAAAAAEAAYAVAYAAYAAAAAAEAAYAVAYAAYAAAAAAAADAAAAAADAAAYDAIRQSALSVLDRLIAMTDEVAA